MKHKICMLIMIVFLAFSVQAEGEATIKNLKVNGVDCSCSGYDCKVEVDATNATITYDLVDSKATVDRLSGFRIDLLSQVTTVKITVTNSEGEEKIENTYNINITKHEKNDDFSLKSLSVNGDKINLLDEVVVYSYVSEFDTEKITIDATTNDSRAKVIKEKEYAFPLKDSSLAIDFKVEAESGKQASYRIVVTRGVKPDTYLKSLTIEPGNINFDKDTHEYKFDVEYGINEIKVEAVPSNKDAKVEIVNEPLVVGENKITITVTNDKSKSEYVLLVTREENIDKSVANLKSLKVKEYSKLDFEENVLDYILYFKNIPKKLNITAKAKNEDAKVTILNNEDLKDNSKVIVKVTLEEDESSISREYTLRLVESEHALEEDNKNIILVCIIGLVIAIIVLIILEIHGKKKERRNYLKKIFELRHRHERKKKEEKKQVEDEIEII